MRTLYLDCKSPPKFFRSLANHGYLPRDGMNISIPMILQAAMDGFNVGPNPIIFAAKVGLLSGDAFPTMDLDALKLHNLIEHDASISRNDLAVTGDNLQFNETIFTTLANPNPGVDYYNGTSAAQVQNTRLTISLTTNPNITNTRKEIIMRTLESSLYLSVMGNALTEIFFREERMPIAEGWKRSNITITADTLNPIESEIILASNWTQTQACEDFVIGPGIVL
ncbi:Cloroperoxidase [Mycena maculata]|uniref:Cloroperoxidase n=1 Tax=Mycena maculata TaxID=230809 RepID=A0AAD7KI23_9AGAR|nr:Cloroperoxidase [Mycena maculata]